MMPGCVAGIALSCLFTQGVLAADGTPTTVTASVDAALTTLRAEVCAPAEGASFTARERGAAAYLRNLRVAESGRRPSVTGDELRLQHGERCINYAIDLDVAASDHSRHSHLSRAAYVVSPSRWLWQPRSPAQTRVRFELPPGLSVSVPWRRIGPDALEYRIPPSPHSDDAVMVIGRFTTCTLTRPWAELEIAAPRGRVSVNAARLATWLDSAAMNVAQAYGRFTQAPLQVVLVPVARGRGDSTEPVPFGHVIRDGGEAVQFFVNPEQPLEHFVADWTATHEFAHLLLPYVEHDENWIAEGFASYYQNVLMARGGHYTAAKAWRKLIEGFRRGERAVPHLTLESAMPLGGWDGIMKTYWGGAAVFLLADLELRTDGGDALTLDDVLARLRQCCLPSARTWSGARLFAKLDRLAGRKVFMPLYERYRARRTLPPWQDATTRLGVRLDGGRAVFDNSAPLAAVREAIMAPTRAREPPRAVTCRTPEPALVQAADNSVR